MSEEENFKLQRFSSPDTHLYQRRWLMLLLFMLMIGLNGAIYAMFSPLTAIIVKVYDVDIFLMNVNSILMALLYVPSTFFLANPMFKYAGIHLTLIAGCVLNVICLWARVAINESFILAMVGGMFYGVAQPLLMNANADIATNWFASHERPIAMSLASMMGSVGGGLGVAYHFIFIDDNDNSDNPDIDITKEHIFNLLFFAALIFSALFAVACAFFREKPPIPPTQSAIAKKEENIGVALKALIRDPNYIIILHAFSFVYGTMTTFSQELALIIEPFGFGSSISALMGISFAIIGFGGAYLSATLVSKTMKYRFATTMVCFGSMAAGLLVLWCLFIQNSVLTILASGLLGFFVMSILSVGLDYACECTFPIAGSATIGAMFSYSQLICTILIVLSSLLLVKSDTGENPIRADKQFRSLCVFGMLIGSIGIGMIFSAFTKEDLRKKRLDSKKAIEDGYETKSF